MVLRRISGISVLLLALLTACVDKPAPPTVARISATPSPSLPVATALQSTPGLPQGTPVAPVIAPIVPDLASAFPAGATMTSILTATIRSGLSDSFVAYQITDPKVGFPQQYLMVLLTAPGGYQAIRLGNVGDQNPVEMKLEDVTGDNIPEVIVTAGVGAHGQRVSIFHWNDAVGRYQRVIDSSSGSIGLTFEDLEGNGAKEMIIGDDAPGTFHAQGIRWPQVFRWNGQQFVPAIYPQVFDTFIQQAEAALASNQGLSRSDLEAALGRALTLQGKADQAGPHYDAALAAYSPGSDPYREADSPTKRIQSYYQAIQYGAFPSAYQMLSSEAQAKQSFADFAAGFAYTHQVIVRQIVEDPSQSGAYHVLVIATDLGAGNPKTQLFDGMWKPKQVGTDWKMDGGRFQVQSLDQLKTINTRPDRAADLHLDAAGPAHPLQLVEMRAADELKSIGVSFVFSDTAPAVDGWILDNGQTLVLWFYGDPNATAGAPALLQSPEPWLLGTDPMVYYGLPSADGGLGLVILGTKAQQFNSWKIGPGVQPGEVVAGPSS